MKKLAYISSIVAPHQVQLCQELQKFFITEFWFYDIARHRGEFWNIVLDNKECRIIPNVFFKERSKYFTFSHIKMLRRFQPDVIMLGGFVIPANFLAYCWARLHKKKVIIFTERSRTKTGKLRKYNLRARIIRFLYRKVDMVMVSAEDIVHQFRDEFKFGNKVVASQYASVIDEYFNHPVRNLQKRIHFIFPNRLTEIYNPLLAIDIFAEIHSTHKSARLFMNELGELRDKCEKKIRDKNLKDAVVFLNNIKRWEDLNDIYAESDIMLLPAIFSNGNFTVIEAMASGIGIVISNKVLGSGKFIIDRYNGYNKEPLKKEFVDAINHLIANPDLIKEYTEINRKLASSYGVNATSKLYASLINRLF
jgi:glycosyltransferase involved in cell wall biosynthesis